MPVTDEIWARAAAAPERPAVAILDRLVSYRALTAAADALAGRLRRRLAAIPEGDRAQDGGGPPRVALACADNGDFVVPFLAALRAGAVACPIDPALPPAARAALIDELGAALTLTGAAAADNLAAAATGPLPPVPVAGDDAAPFLITFTAGSTGRPKGIERSHRSWLASLAVASEAFPLAVEDRVLVAGPLVHSLSLFALVETLAAGATVALLPRFDAGAALALIAAGGVTRIVGVPALFAALVAQAAADARLPAVRMLIVGGARLEGALARRLRRLFCGARLITYYGASELSFVSIADADAAGPEGSAGRPPVGVALSVRDGAGRPVADGVVGELWVRSPLLATGIVVGDGVFRRDADGWATVGDLARLDAAGWVHLAGRGDGMLVSAGRNIYPAALERVLALCPAIADAVALGVADPAVGERLVAVVRWRPGMAIGRDRLLAHCRGHLAAHACPKQVFVAEAIPLTAAGKPALARLRAAILDGAPGLVELGG